MFSPVLTISIVSHNQLHLVQALLEDIQRYVSLPLEIVLTLNVEESSSMPLEKWNLPIRIIKNERPKGFGENHNSAFRYCAGEYFCVLNPDIRLHNDPFPQLIARLSENNLGVVSPLIRNSQGGIEDSARRFPTILSILRKLLGKKDKNEYRLDSDVYPDWVAGMFMVFGKNVFSRFGGFNTQYFLYYEDVDLCARMHLEGYPALMDVSTVAIHDAQRESHRSLKYLNWHISSMLRFFVSPAFIRIMLKRNFGCQGKRSDE